MQKLGREPDVNKAPVEEWHFPFEVQQAFSIHRLLSDTWEGMSGSYLGKNWVSVELLLKVFDVTDKKEVILFLKSIDALYMQQMNDKLEKERKAKEQKAKGQARSQTPTTPRRK
tara:strand:- start:257 stop:598 length:342 start_codon:yes stop_codon:yes gene_type:complete